MSGNVVNKLHYIIIYRLVLSFFLYVENENEPEEVELRAVDALLKC
jgi:hypothetical protein